MPIKKISLPHTHTYAKYPQKACTDVYTKHTHIHIHAHAHKGTQFDRV